MRPYRRFDLCCLKNGLVSSPQTADLIDSNIRTCVKMADYTAPFHMPEFADDKYLAKKAEYVKEHGYSITLPRFSDIVHLGMHKPMTNQEKILWYSGRKMEIGKSRQLELYYQKARSKERYEKMMASPIPNVVSSITSVLTAVDDAQDAIISLASIGRIACFFFPG